MPEKDASTGAEPTQQEPASTGTDDSEIKVELAPEQQEPASTGDDPGQQERDAAKAAAEADAAKAGETKTAEEAKAAAEAEEKTKAEDAAAQGERDRVANLRQLERRATTAEERLRGQATREQQQRRNAADAEWDRMANSEDPAERDKALRHEQDKKAKEKAATAAWGRAEQVVGQKVAEEEFQRALAEPFFKESGLTPEELNAAMAAKDAEARAAGEAFAPFSSLLGAAATAVVAKKDAELTEAQGQVTALETKVASLSAQLTDAGIVASGSPPPAPNGSATPGGLTPESYRKTLKTGGDQPDADDIDKMTAHYLEQ